MTSAKNHWENDRQLRAEKYNYLDLKMTKQSAAHSTVEEHDKELSWCGCTNFYHKTSKTTQYSIDLIKKYYCFCSQFCQKERGI